MMLRLDLATLTAFAILSLAGATGCGGTITTGSGGGSSSSSSNTTTTGSSTASTSSGSAACPTTSASDLQGVHLEIDGAACTFSLSDPAQVTLPYHVVVDQDTSGVTPRTQDTGGCGQPGPSGLITFGKVDGNAQQYCLCDVGECPPPSGPAVTLKKGSYPATFTWDKRNWFGPSDTNNPEGMTFPAGDYTFTVSAIGLQAVPDGDVGFVITATMPVHLVP